jgi:hypothetical protein
VVVGSAFSNALRGIAFGLELCARGFNKEREEHATTGTLTAEPGPPILCPHMNTFAPSVDNSIAYYYGYVT